MLTLLYYVLHSLSLVSTRLSEYINYKLEHKRLCKKIWKNRKQTITLENTNAWAIIIKNTSTNENFLSQLNVLFTQNANSELKTLSSSSTTLTKTELSNHKLTQNIETPINAPTHTSNETTPSPSMKEPLSPFIIPNSDFIISEITMPDNITNLPTVQSPAEQPIETINQASLSISTPIPNKSNVYNQKRNQHYRNEYRK